MAGLSDIVSINLTTQTAAVKQPSFGVPLLLAATTEFSERSRVYTGRDGVISDGFAPKSAAVRMVDKLLAQNPQVEQFRIGRRANAPLTQYKLTPAAVNGATYNVDVESVTKTFTADGTATSAEIATGLVAAIGAISGWTITTADAGASVTITSTVPGAVLSIRPHNIALIGLAQTHADAGVTADLDAILLESSDWYGLALSTGSEAEILATAAWTEANKRLHMPTTNDTVNAQTVATGATDVGGDLKSLNYARSPGFFTEDTCGYNGVSALALFLATLPGSTTLKFKTLLGTRASNLTPTQQANLQGRNLNVYVEYGGLAMVTEGVVPVGEFVDVVRDSDWFGARLQTELFALLKNAPKIPYTDAGLVRIEGVLRAVGREAETAGFLVPGSFTIIMPRIANLPQNDKAVRLLGQITFGGVIAGAIHKLGITGTLTLA